MMQAFPAFTARRLSREPRPVSSGFDADCLLGLLCAWLLGKRDRQNTLIEAGVDLIRLYVCRNAERTLKRAELPLRDVVIFLLFLFALFPLTFDRQDVAVELDLNVLFIDARQVGFEFESPVFLNNVDRGSHRERELRSTKGLKMRCPPARRHSPDLPVEILENPLHLVPEAAEKIPVLPASRG